MRTGIYRAGIVGEDEISQNNIDYWCNHCQFPIGGGGKCQRKEQVQQCWNRVGANAGAWHLLHECPFTHVNQSCSCNDFKARQEAFASVGLVYQEPK